MSGVIETPRLRLRGLEEKDIPLLGTLLNNWNVVRWMTRIPFPYTHAMAQEWFLDCQQKQARDAQEFFVLADKKTDAFLGGIGLHPPTSSTPTPGAVEMGYWLGEPAWGQGLMSEAACAMVPVAFARPTTQKIVASTNPANSASQKVLRKAGLAFLGLFPSLGGTLRDAPTMTLWALPRAEFESRGTTTA